MTVRVWEERDLPNILALEEKCFSCPWTENMLVQSFQSDGFFGLLIEENGEIVAYHGGVILYELSETLLVAVREDFRRKGLAAELLIRFETEAKRRGAERALLEVRVGNEPAKSLYQKLGYQKLTVRKKYYPDNDEDAIVMCKEL